MVFRATAATGQGWLANGLVLAFPVLLLGVPRGSGVFLAAILVGAILSARAGGRLMALHGEWLKPLGLAILAVAAVCLASKVYFDLEWSALDNPSRTLLAWLACLVILRYRPDSRWLWYGVPVAIALTLVIITYQKLALGEARPAAWVQPIAFANMVAAFGLIGFVRPGQRAIDHLLGWGVLIAAVAVLVVNGSRGAWLALMVTTVVMLPVRHRHLRPVAFVALVAMLVAAAAALYALPDSPVAKRVDKVGQDIAQFKEGNPDSSTGARLLMWQLAASAVKEHPWTGVGLGQFSRLTRELPACQASHKRHEFCLEHAHNDVMEALATTGIPGLLALMGMFLVPAALFWRLLRRSHDDYPVGMSLAAAGLAVVMTSVIGGLTQVTMAHQANIVFYAGTVGLLLGLAIVHQGKPPNKIEPL